MTIGIDASRAFVGERTGIEEYSYQLIKHLSQELSGEQVVLYVRKGQRPDFSLPEKWRIREIRLPILWTQIGLSLELFIHPVKALFIPAHVVPCIHPKRTIVTVHGLEFEIFPRGYSFWERIYMRSSIKASCFWAGKIIAVSESTKNDLINLYRVPEKKIAIVSEGYEQKEPENVNYDFEKNTRYQIPDTRYLIFIGRLEKRKNVEGIIGAFEILKEKYGIPHQLVLAGKPGHGFGSIKLKAKNSEHAKDIIFTGYISQEEKKILLKNATVFLFPSFCEGFGLPILEAQAAGVPVVTADRSSMPEVAGEGAILVDPGNLEAVADRVWMIISDAGMRNGIIEKGKLNLSRFGWKQAARELARVIMVEKS